MSAARRKDGDIIIKLLLIGDSGVGKSCLLLRYTDDQFQSSFITTIGIDFKIKSLELEGQSLKLQVWDTAGQERFKTITSAYYRGAMGIIMVYDVTDEVSFGNIKKWMRNIEQNASSSANKILVGNKSDMGDKARAVTYASGKALADTYGLDFFETSAKTAANVDEMFTAIARTVVQRLNREAAAKEAGETGTRSPPVEAEESGAATVAVDLREHRGGKKKKGKCCN